MTDNDTRAVAIALARVEEQIKTLYNRVDRIDSARSSWPTVLSSLTAVAGVVVAIVALNQ